MSERLMLKGARDEKRRAANSLATRAQGLIRAIRVTLNPDYMIPLKDLRVNEVRELVCELEDIQEKYLQLCREIEEIERELL